METVRQAAESISLEYPREGDGRLTSAIKEKEYLEALKKKIPHLEIPKERAWYDFKVGDLFFNLKLTDGGTDNAFNKTALLFTFDGKVRKSVGSMNAMLKCLQDTKPLRDRDPATEYHYLVVNKKTGRVLCKSIVDIHTYVPNCAGNVMQINWKTEFEHMDYVAPDRVQKVKELIQTVQLACRKQMANMAQFAEFNADSLM